MREGFRVDFLVIGARKAGTTYVDNVLREHPGVTMSNAKEVNFFNDYIHFPSISELNTNYSKGLKWYRSNFPKRLTGKVGEVTPAYIDRPEVPARIRKMFPDARIIAIVREPISRAYSHYLYNHHFLMIDDSNTFEEAIRKHPEYISCGMYHEMLTRFLKRFPREHISVFLLDDLKTNPAGLVREIYRSVGVDEDYAPACMNKRANAARRTRFRSVKAVMGLVPKTSRMLRRIGLGKPIDFLRERGFENYINTVNERWNVTKLEKQPLKEKTRKALIKRYRKDVKLLGEMLDRDLLEMWGYGR